MMGENTSLGTSKLAIIVVTMVALSTMVLHGAEATTYVVGDSVGWRVPPSTNTYSNWSSSYNFSVGDILVFNFVTSQHDVAQTTKAKYDSCEDDSPTQLLTNGPANFTLNSTETYYFICTIDSHCESGMKVSVTVGSTSGPTSGPSANPPGTSTTNPSPPPPPAGSGSGSLAATSKAILLSVAIGLGFMWI